MDGRKLQKNIFQPFPMKDLSFEVNTAFQEKAGMFVVQDKIEDEEEKED